MKPIIFTLLLSIFILLSCDNKVREEQKPIHSTSIDFSQAKIVDLTHLFSEETIYWVTAKEFELDVVAKGETDKGYFYSANNFATAEHGGTHIDAPIHFSKNGQATDEIPLEKLVGSAIKIDVSKKALPDPDYKISIEDFLDWEKRENIQIPDGSIVLLETGFSKFYPDKLKYLGTDKRGSEAIKDLHFPGLSNEAAEWLVKHRNINAIGIDTPSIDYGQSQYFKSHVTLLSENIPAFENLMNLDQLPSKEFNIIALPMKIKGGSGGPLRIIALLNN
ncbi:cyclase family protein [Aquimarina algiphila]|uniref:cyclase family protein n=1 Tax=Aquimarina algiphila TaxID=2047982 RepID=UPI00232F5DA3|nr:cyclase family protein [Aquimarina algiphila]